MNDCPSDDARTLIMSLSMDRIGGMDYIYPFQEAGGMELWNRNNNKKGGGGKSSSNVPARSLNNQTKAKQNSSTSLLPPHLTSASKWQPFHVFSLIDSSQVHLERFLAVPVHNSNSNPREQELELAQEVTQLEVQITVHWRSGRLLRLLWQEVVLML